MSAEDVELFINQLEERNEMYHEADAYFRGAPPEVFSNARIKAKLGLNDGSFRENYAAVPVKALASRMSLNGFSVPNNQRATDFLSDLWVDSGMHLEFSSFLRDLSKYGEGYLEIGTDEEGAIDLCPASVTKSQMVYFAGDLRVKLFFGKLSSVPIMVGREIIDARLVTLKYADRIERWYEPTPDSNVWFPYFSDDLDDEDVIAEWEINELGEIPAVHFRNEIPFGVPEHFEAYGAQDQIVKIVMNHMGVIDMAGLPERWVALEAGNPGAGGDYGTPGDNGFIDDGDLSTAGGPGTLNLFKSARAVGEFKSADVSQFINSKSEAKRSIAVLTETPIRYFVDPEGGNFPSGESLRASDSRFKAKIQHRQEMYGFSLAEAFRLVLRAAGFEVVEYPTVKWKPQTIEQDASLFALVEQKVKLGIPRYYALLEAGYPEDTLAAWGYSPTDPPELPTAP